MTAPALHDRAVVIDGLVVSRWSRGVFESMRAGQNTSPLEDDLPHLEVFRSLGVRVVQRACKTQNAIGSGCYESATPGCRTSAGTRSQS